MIAKKCTDCELYLLPSTATINHHAISTFLSPDSSKQIFPAGITSGEQTTAIWKFAFPTIVFVALNIVTQ